MKLVFAGVFLAVEITIRNLMNHSRWDFGCYGGQTRSSFLLSGHVFIFSKNFGGMKIFSKFWEGTKNEIFFFGWGTKIISKFQKPSCSPAPIQNGRPFMQRIYWNLVERNFKVHGFISPSFTSGTRSRQRARGMGCKNQFCRLKLDLSLNLPTEFDAQNRP